MLEKAKESHVYDKLLNQEVVSFLKETHKQYDLITGIEVLEYIPNITDLFQQIPNNLVSDGLFVFSIETTNESNPILAPHGRYLYPINYVENLLQEHGLKVLNKKEINLRQATGFPPFSNILRILISSVSDNRAKEVTKKLFDKSLELKEKYGKEIIFLQAMPSPVKRIQSKFRYQILTRYVPNDKITCDFFSISDIINCLRGVIIGKHIH